MTRLSARSLLVVLLCFDLNTFENNYFTEMCSGSEAGSYLRLIDSCIPQLKAQRPLGPVTRVKKKKKKLGLLEAPLDGSVYARVWLCLNQHCLIQRDSDWTVGFWERHESRQCSASKKQCSAFSLRMSERDCVWNPSQ